MCESRVSGQDRHPTERGGDRHPATLLDPASNRVVPNLTPAPVVNVVDVTTTPQGITEPRMWDADGHLHRCPLRRRPRSRPHPTTRRPPSRSAGAP